MIPLIVATAVGCLVLMFQCKKLGRLLFKKNIHGQVQQVTQPPRASDRGNVRQLKGLSSQRRSSAKKQHAELAEEIRAMNLMQMELTSQLGELQTYLTQMKNLRQSQGGAITTADEPTDKRDWNWWTCRFLGFYVLSSSSWLQFPMVLAGPWAEEFHSPGHGLVEHVPWPKRLCLFCVPTQDRQRPSYQ